MTKDPNLIDAYPTKELFVYMLVRDLNLGRAILDLLDNSVDGAHRLQQDNDYSNFHIRIDFDENKFKIVDDCGGIEVNVARNYAFCFGKPEGAEFTPGSIGKFGVGMKRTLFKLGKNFKVVSKTTSSIFEIEEDVDEWKSRKDDWHFKFKELDEKSSREISETGTSIEINNIYENIASEFKLENFKTTLINEIEKAYSVTLDRGLNISLNGIPIRSHDFMLFNSDQIKPAHFHKVYDLGAYPVTVRIYAGIANRDKAKGGWYIFCNGRMVLEADQTKITGWDEEFDDGKMRKYHADFAFFRGYVFFDCDDAGLLPWTTTKTGVDVDSPIFKAVKLEMISLMKPVLEFLTKLATERGEYENKEEREQEKIVELTPMVKYSNASTNNFFIQPILNVERREPTTQRIQYSKAIDKVVTVKAKLRVATYKEVGEKTFDYFYQMECE